MALKASVDTLDDVPAHFHELYTQVGDKFNLTGVEGMKPLDEFNTVYSSLTKERNDHKLAKQKLATFTAFGDPTELQNRLDRIPELEAAAGGKLDDVAINKLVDGRIGGKLAPVQRQLETALTENATLRETIGKYETSNKQRTITDELRIAATKIKVLDTAFEDAALLAERVFDVDEDGRIVAKQGMGCTPGITPEVWLIEMQQKRPHWWGPSMGGGARGSGAGGAAGGSNPWTAENWNMTEQGQILRENRTKAEQLARSAGTTIGGAKPAAKK